MHLINFLYHVLRIQPHVGMLDIPQNMPTPVSVIYFRCIFIVYQDIMILFMV